MSKTMLALLGVLVAVLLAIVFDSPAEPAQVVEVAERRERQSRVEVAPGPETVHSGIGFNAEADGPIPDLFAAAGPVKTDGPVPAERAAPESGEASAPPFGLIGFNNNDGVREAYLMRNGAVVTARTGAMLEKRYRVQSLRADAVQIKDTRSGEILLIAYGEEE